VQRTASYVPNRQICRPRYRTLARTSFRDPRANQFSLLLHTAAYWLSDTLRRAKAKCWPLSMVEFFIRNLYLLKIAARVVECAA
jgi:hypothetical protein